MPRFRSTHFGIHAGNGSRISLDPKRKAGRFALGLLFLSALIMSLGTAPAGARVTCGGLNEKGQWLGGCSAKPAVKTGKASGLDCKVEGSFFDPIDGGTCWKCPKLYQRNWNHVKSPDACYTTAIGWETPKFPVPGIYDLPGTEEVVKNLYGNPFGLTSFMRVLGGRSGLNGKRLDAFVEDGWKKHATPDGQLIKGLLYNRIVALAQTGQGSAADKKLLKSFEAFIRNFRIHMTQDAVNAYDAWKKSDDYRKARTPPNMMVLYDIGTTPPDFSANVQSIVMGAGLGAAAVGVAAAWSYSGISAAAAAAATAANAAVATGSAATSATYAAANAAAANAAAAAATASTATAMGAVAVAAPFAIMVGVSLNKFIEIVNARPKLVAALNKAKKPVSLKTMLQTKAATQEASAYWAMIARRPANGGLLGFTYKQAYKARYEKPIGTSAEVKGTSQTVTVINPNTGQKQQTQITTFDSADFKKQQAEQAALAKSPPGPHKWQKINGAATDIAVDDNGWGWVLGTRMSANGYDIYQLPPGASDWRRVPGEAMRISAGDTVWVVNRKGEIYRLNGKRWQKVNGPKAIDIGASSKGVWMLGGPPRGKNYGVYKLQGSTWKFTGGYGSRVDVDAAGQPWVLASDKTLWVYGAGQWLKMSGAGLDIGVGPLRTAALVGADNQVWRRDGKSGNWASAKVDAQAIAVGPNDKAWIVGPKNEIFREK